MSNIQLLKPQFDLDYSLMKALKNRRTKRKFSSEVISLQEMSNILWAACGETKKGTSRSKNRRTIPSACNSQKISLYVAVEKGIYKYNEKKHILEFVNDIDIRKDLSTQKMLKSAPFGLIYVFDYQVKTGILKHNDSKQMLLVGTEVGAISQNVYLYCAEANLSTVVVALLDKDKLVKSLGLSGDKSLVYTQIIGKIV